MATHIAKNVPGDGNCLYTCIVRTCGWAIGVGNDDLAVTRLRGVVANKLMTSHAAQATVENLLRTLASCREARRDFPLVANRDAGRKGMESMAAAVLSDGTWASQVEHQIVKDILAKVDIDLITLQCRDLRTLSDDLDVEEQLAKALNVAELTHCVVLIHLADEHYMYMTLGPDPAPERETFLSYITAFLEE